MKNNSIPTEIAEEVSKQISCIEASHGVTTILAIESGSRAWGFAADDLYALSRMVLGRSG